MYTLEQRERAVELYVRYGRKATATMRELGYPKSRQQLRAWYREWEEHGGALEGRSMQRYTDAQKRAAVDHYLEHGRCGAYTRRELGYPKSWKKLADWIDELAPGQRRAAEPRTFSATQKAEAVEALLTRGGPAREVAEAAGSSRCALYKWRKELLVGDRPGAPAGAAKRGPRSTKADVDALEARVAELEGELRRLELRRAVVEGALAIRGKGRGADPLNELTNREKTLLVESLLCFVA